MDRRHDASTRRQLVTRQFLPNKSALIIRFEHDWTGIRVVLTTKTRIRRSTSSSITGDSDLTVSTTTASVDAGVRSVARSVRTPLHHFKQQLGQAQKTRTYCKKSSTSQLKRNGHQEAVQRESRTLEQKKDQARARFRRTVIAGARAFDTEVFAAADQQRSARSTSAHTGKSSDTIITSPGLNSRHVQFLGRLG